jgi:ADP-heptose:LPS heptosyltransferase
VRTSIETRHRTRDRPTVLTLRALGLGDLLAAVPALRAIGRAFPHHRRVLATPARLGPLAAMTGSVDQIVDAEALEPVETTSAPDVAINLHGSGPQSHRALLTSHPRRLIAFEHAGVRTSAGSPRWRSDEHEVVRWCRLLQESGIPADPEDLGLPRPRRPHGTAGATVIHPGAASAARRWPAERWTLVCRAEAEAGRAVVLTGTSAERASAADIARAAGLPPSSVLAGRTDVRALAALVAWAGVVASGDTGVAHLATAFATPSVVLFGPTPPDRWGPPVDRPQHVVLWRGRTGDPHAETADPGLLEIEVDEVIEAIGRARTRTARTGPDGPGGAR